MEKKLRQKFVILVFGPTGVGKSGFAEKLASTINSQIVNCDIGQFYTPFGIGTAKPANWKTSKIKQHLFDIIDEPRDFSAHEYRTLLLQTIENIWQQESIPILVGGSGFYLKSLFFPPVSNANDESSSLISASVDIPAAARKELWRARQEDSGSSLWDMLYKIDPERAKKIDKNDTYRIQRALDIWAKTGKKPSEFKPVFNFPSNFLFVFLHRDRTALYERINKRTYQMIQEGWIDEVECLLGTKWEQFFKEKKLIGYDTIVEYLRGDKSPERLEETIKTIQQKTRNYAKRQITFWKSFEKQLKKAMENNMGNNRKVKSRIENIKLTLSGPDLYIEKLLDYLKDLFE